MRRIAMALGVLALMMVLDYVSIYVLSTATSPLQVVGGIVTLVAGTTIMVFAICREALG